MTDGPLPPDEAEEPASARAPLLDPPVAVEAVFAFFLSGLLCWNAWPWIAAQAAGGGGGGGPDAGAAGPADPSAIVAAVLLYGLAWPAIAAAVMGALHYALRGLAPGLRLKISGALLVVLVASAWL